MLLANAADPNPVDRLSHTPMMNAVANGSLQMVEVNRWISFDTTFLFSMNTVLFTRYQSFSVIGRKHIEVPNLIHC